MKKASKAGLRRCVKCDGLFKPTDKEKDLVCEHCIQILRMLNWDVPKKP